MNPRICCSVCMAVLTLCFIPATTTEAQLFDVRIDYEVDGYAQSVAIGDLDGDGNLDMAVANSGYEDNNVSVLLGNGDGTFQEPVNYWTGDESSPWSVAIGDLNGDGNPDLVAASYWCYYDYYETYYYDPYVSVLLGNGDGTFQEAVSYEVFDGPHTVAIGDLDGDGNPDLAVACSIGNHFYPGKVSVLLGNGDGTFQGRVDIAAGDNPYSVAIGDLDGDGDSDLAVACKGDYPLSPGEVSILLGNGDGTFQAPVIYDAAGVSPLSVAIGDLDSDGHSDLAVVNYGVYGNGSVSVLLGNGDGTFQGAGIYTAGVAPRSVATSDLDGDGNPDLAVAGSTGHYDDPGKVSVLLGNGDGTFQADVNYSACAGACLVATSDLDVDGNPDLVVANLDSYNVSVLLGNGDGSFPTSISYGAGLYPYSVTIDDLDGDSNPDLAVANYDSDNVSVLLGTGDGTFQDAVNYDAGEVPQSVATSDLDGDGNPDLAVACRDSYPDYPGKVAILLGNGDGTFQDAVNIEIGSGVYSLAIGDLDGDGNPDVALVNWMYSASNGYVSVLLGNGDGTFQSAVRYDVGRQPLSVAIGDLDGDGSPDLATANSDSDDLSVLLGNGDGTFQAAVEYSADVAPYSVAIDDLDDDGNPDLAVACRGHYPDYPGKVSILLGNGDGTFQAAVRYGVGRAPYSVAIDDLDGDSNPDLTVASSGSDNVSVLLGNGDGTFKAAVYYGAGNSPRSVAIGDLDGDGNPDLAVANRASFNVSVLINITGKSPRILAGPGPAYQNSPLVRVFLPALDVLPVYEFHAYGALNFGVKVACGDCDDDGVDEILTGAGPGEIYGPHVRGFVVDGTPLPGLSFLAYGTNRYGVNVAAGDIDGDGFAEIITGAGPGAVFGPHVRGWDYDGTPGVTPVPGVSYFAYGTPKWGVNVSAGDLDGDGFDEIVTGAGPGAVYGPHVRGWNVDGSTAAAIPGVSFLAYGTNKYGVNVTCGDVDGDGVDEIITGAGPGAVFGPHVRGWNYDGSSITSLPGCSFFAWDDVRFGVNVFAGADLNGDGRDELVVGCGPDPEAGTEVKVFEYDDAGVTLWFSLEAFEDLTHGVNVAAGQF